MKAQSAKAHEVSGGEPAHVRAGPCHPDPYPYYSRLAVERPLYRESPAGAWVAASAAAVTAVLTSPICFTRPVTAPIPSAMAETPVAEIFGRLVRITDGEIHCPMKSAITTTLDGLDPDMLAADTWARAAALGAEIEPEREVSRVTKFAAQLPAQVIASLLGVAPEHFDDVGRWVGDYGVATAAAATGVPPVSPALMDAGAESARRLLDLFRGMLSQLGETDDNLYARLARQAPGSAQADNEGLVANAIGLMTQGFAATSALTGSTLLALARHPEALAAVLADRGRLADVIEEVVRCDPVTQSTPRFVAADGVVAGQAMRAGDTIIVVLASANRDPALNPDPDRFDIDRKDRRYVEFGAGVHACPGQTMARLIAEAAVGALLDRGIAMDRLEAQVTYRPSAHIRFPVFG